jgi:thiol:disulfide interchange protein DsbD
MFTAITTALLALLTPCVFPMIPITVGFFSGRPDRSTRTIRRELFTFAGGIVAAFVILGVGVSLLLGATGAFTLAANPWMNLAVAALFAGFALQLAGLVRIGAPHGLVTKLSFATQTGHGTPLLLLMGVTFALTSFTCTAPFVGSLLVLAASGGVVEPIVGVLAFAMTFAAPFVVLALAPALAGRLPRSGPWLETVKRVAAFAELAVVVKFVSNAGMVWGWQWMTRDVVIVAWIGLLLGLLITLSWPTSTHAQTSRRGASGGRVVGRIVSYAAALALGGWLVRGLQGNPLGELESYLPPRDGSAIAATGELPWTVNNWPAVTARATVTQRPILVDFTGYTCTNCRWMEANMFTRPAVQAMLARFERSRLFTDGTGEPYLSQQALQAERFGSVALPLYVVIHPDGRLAAQFVGMTRDEREFLSFLASGISAMN